MIDKANVIYDRWSAGYELPSVVLGPSTSDDGGTDPGGSLQHNTTMDHHYGISSVNQYGVEQPQPSDSDPFARFHPRLVQCVVEIRQRAKSLLLSRNASQPTTWGPIPVMSQAQSPYSPVLPPEVPEFARTSYSQNGFGDGYIDAGGMSSSSSPSFYSNTDMMHPGAAAFPQQWAPSTSMGLSPTSKMAIVDTINFELGALNDQSWMAFF